MAQQTMVGSVKAPDFPRGHRLAERRASFEHGGPEGQDSHPGLLDILLS